MNDDGKENVEALIKKAGAAFDSSDAMRFSQAACNVANALCALASIELKPSNDGTQ